jgi:hypothetical protein
MVELGSLKENNHDEESNQAFDATLKTKAT